MAKTKQRLDWRSLASQIINDEDLHDPDVQMDHPVVKELTEIVFLNGLTDEEKEAARSCIMKTGKSLPMKTYYKIARNGKPDIDELSEMLFAGLMTDADYEDYIEMKEQKPKISARDYYTKLCAHNEKDAAVKKLARIFEAILDAPETNEEYVPHISRAEFEKMKHDIEWVKKNLKGLEKSRKIWS